MSATVRPIGRRTVTEFVRWGNGPDDTDGYSRSLVHGYLTTQQFAAFLGVNQGTARDVMSGRRTGQSLGVRRDGVWLITYLDAMAYALEHRT